MSQKIIHCSIAGCSASVAGATKREACLAARSAGWAGLIASGGAGKAIRCPRHRTKRESPQRLRPAEQRVIDLLDEIGFYSASDVAERLGFSRQRAEQIRTSLEARGLWRWNGHVVACVDCGAECDTGRKVGSLRQRMEEIGWGVFGSGSNTANYGWRCPECLKQRLHEHYDLKPWEPQVGTLAARVLEWMESGRSYHATMMAKEFGTYQTDVSRAKGVLIVHGLWKWDLRAPYRGSRPINPDSPNLRREAARMHPRRIANLVPARRTHAAL